MSDTVQTGTGKVDPARKFKCSSAARDGGRKKKYFFSNKRERIENMKFKL